MRSTTTLAVCLLAALAGLAAAPAHVKANVTISLSVSSSTPTSGAWESGDLIEIIIQAHSDGAANQGFAGADFKTGSFGLTVDTGLLKIHDMHVDVFGTLTQVDTEADAGLYDPAPDYAMLSDTWVYDDMSDFVGSVDMSDGAFEAVASAPVASGLGLGVGTPVDFLHVVLEVQPGLTPGNSADVTFSGQLTAYNVLASELDSDVFGTAGGDISTGSFSVAVTPEPATTLILLAGLGLQIARRRSRR